MGKFSGMLGKGKGFGKSVMNEALPPLLITAGVVGSQKFLDFKTVAEKFNLTVKPDSFFMKHEGIIKMGGVVVTLAMWKKCPVWLKWLLIGVAVQGGIKAVKQYTINDAGKSFIDYIGDGNNYSDEINEAAKQIIDFAANTSNTGVSGENTSTLLNAYSATGVSGMGSDNDYNYN